MRATEEENGNFLGEQHAPRDSLRGARSLPTYLSYSVALRRSSVSSVVKKARVRLQAQTINKSTCGSFGVTTSVLPST